MSPLDHLDWALGLPLCMGLGRPPDWGVDGVSPNASRVAETRSREARRSREAAQVCRRRIPPQLWLNPWLHLGWRQARQQEKAQARAATEAEATLQPAVDAMHTVH